MPENPQYYKNEFQRIKSLSPKILREKFYRVRESFLGKKISESTNNDRIPYPYVRFSLTDSDPPIHPSYIEDIADLLIWFGNFDDVDLLFTEGDRGGGLLIQAVAGKTGLPYCVANRERQPLLGVEGIKYVAIDPGFSGSEFLGATLPSEVTISIVDDLVSTGKTHKGLITLAEMFGSHVKQVLCAGEKVNLGGRKVIEAMDVQVISLVPFNADPAIGYTTDAHIFSHVGV